MKRSYIILLIGASTLAAGTVIFGVNSSILAVDFLFQNLVIKNAIIEPNERYVTWVTIQSEGTVSVLMRAQPFENDVRASIIDDKGNTVWQQTFNGDYVGNFEAQQAKKYQVVFKNVDSSNVSVDAIVGNVPFLGVNNYSGMANVQATLSGLALGVIGLFTLVVGSVWFFAERRSKKIKPVI